MNEPRMLLDQDSICYGCKYYRLDTECTQDHSDFDENCGTCDVDTICVSGNMNGYIKVLKRKGTKC